MYGVQDGVTGHMCSTMVMVVGNNNIVLQSHWFFSSYGKSGYSLFSEAPERNEHNPRVAPKLFPLHYAISRLFYSFDPNVLIASSSILPC